MKKILSICSLLFILVIGQVAVANTGVMPLRNNVEIKHVDAMLAFQKNVNNALMCFKTRETISGMNKICYYDCAGSEAAITIKSYELCPLNINR